MDVMNIIEEIISMVDGNNDLKANFMKDPVNTIKSITAMEIPEDQIDTIVDAVKAKVGAESISDLWVPDTEPAETFS